MNKLKEQKGESIMMALLLVLVASVVSAVILTASIQAARRPRNERAAQQSYLTVSSAAEMVRDSILAAEYKREVIEEYELDPRPGIMSIPEAMSILCSPPALWLNGSRPVSAMTAICRDAAIP